MSSPNAMQQFRAYPRSAERRNKASLGSPTGALGNSLEQQNVENTGEGLVNGEEGYVNKHEDHKDDRHNKADASTAKTKDKILDLSQDKEDGSDDASSESSLSADSRSIHYAHKGIRPMKTSRGKRVASDDSSSLALSLADSDSGHERGIRHINVAPPPPPMHDATTSEVREFLKHSTISDDRSEGSEYAKQRLAWLALKPTKTHRNSPRPPPPGPKGTGHPPTGWSGKGPPPPESQRRGYLGTGSLKPGTVSGPPSWGRGVSVKHSGPVIIPKPAPRWIGQQFQVHYRGLPPVGELEPEELKSSGDAKRPFVKLLSEKQLDAAAQDESPDDVLEPDDILNLDPEESRKYILNLQNRSRDLDVLRRQLEPSKVIFLYRILEDGRFSIYIDHPQWVTYNDESRKLHSSSQISSIPSYLERNRDIAFIIFRDFDADKLEEIDQRNRNNSTQEDYDENAKIMHTDENIAPISSELKAAINQLLKSSSQLEGLVTGFDIRNEIKAPYLLIYHTRKTVADQMKMMSEKRRRQISLLLKYVNDTYEEEYTRADSLLSRGMISWRFIEYLFKPDDLVVWRKDENLSGFMSQSILKQIMPPRIAKRSGSSNHDKIKGSSDGSNKPRKIKWQLDVWSWVFDGNFKRKNETLTLEHDPDDDSEKKIEDLDLKPLSHVQGHIRNRLERRGKMFWKCRIRHIVSFHKGPNPDLQSPDDERYMIDMKTFREIHFKETLTSDTSDLLPGAMARDEPPDGNFVFLLPLSLKGFNLRQKKWLDVPVDRIKEVSWNKEAFKTLVLDRKTKDLIQALVSNQITAEKSTDLISGKGNGLILLLHGGPGTGKTLTAESVAEIAEKPLYRVTCGDIGILPEEVERYLESVLYLGKVWDCIVLLDEADVFLEERSLADLQRNALVSVFLRMLEYYDGILILTSNRVGTFDEAFKSRIQLALHYENLNLDQRRQIWENFFDRLESLGETNIDFADLRDHLGQLAKKRMNGRQIRNAITTARQYVQWKTTQSAKTSDPKITYLDYRNLKDIIETSGKFDLYIDKLNGGNTQDQLAQDAGLRLSQWLKPEKKVSKGGDESDGSE